MKLLYRPSREVVQLARTLAREIPPNKYAKGLSKFSDVPNVTSLPKTIRADIHSIVPEYLRNPEPFEYNPEYHHVVLNPENVWSSIGSPEKGNGNYSFSVNTPKGMYFVKEAKSDPSQIGKEKATRYVLNKLVPEFHVPKVVSFIHPHFGESLVSPWIKHDTLLSMYPDEIEKEYDPHWKNFKPDSLANLLASEWLLHAVDRNMGNYGFDKLGKIVPLDYAESLEPSNLHGARRTLDPISNNAMFQIAELADKIKRTHKINPNFLKHLYVQGIPLVEEGINSIAHPYLAEGQVEEANRLIRDKSKVLKDLLLKGKPVRLLDLPTYKEGTRIDSGDSS